MVLCQAAVAGLGLGASALAAEGNNNVIDVKAQASGQDGGGVASAARLGDAGV